MSARSVDGKDIVKKLTISLMAFCEPQMPITGLRVVEVWNRGDFGPERTWKFGQRAKMKIIYRRNEELN